MEVINVKCRIHHQELSVSTRTNSGLPWLFITCQYVNTNNPVCPRDYPRIIHSILLFFMSPKRLLWLTHGSSFHSFKLIIISWDLQILITIDNTLRYYPLFLMVPPPLGTAADNLSSSQLQNKGSSQETSLQRKGWKIIMRHYSNCCKWQTWATKTLQRWVKNLT